jgi:hypothetical protein
MIGKLRGPLFAAAGLLAIGSAFLPWKHPHNHASELCADLEALALSLREEEGGGGRDWIGAAYFLGKALALTSPAVFGLGLLAAALPWKRSGRAVAGASAQLAALALPALSLWLLSGVELLAAGENRRGKYLWLLLGGGALMAALSALQAWMIHRCVRRRRGFRLLPLPALLFYLVAGFGTAWAMRGNDQWHTVDYAVLGLASLLGLGGVWMDGGDEPP